MDTRGYRTSGPKSGTFAAIGGLLAGAWCLLVLPPLFTGDIWLDKSWYIPYIVWVPPIASVICFILYFSLPKKIDDLRAEYARNPGSSSPEVLLAELRGRRMDAGRAAGLNVDPRAYNAVDASKVNQWESQYRQIRLGRACSTATPEEVLREMASNDPSDDVRREARATLRRLGK